MASELFRRPAKPSVVTSYPTASFRTLGATLREVDADGTAVALFPRAPVTEPEEAPVCDVVGVGAAVELAAAIGAVVPGEGIFGSGRFCMTEYRS